MKNIIYSINVINFDKHNKSLKKGHKAVMISTGFLTDAKVKTLPLGGKVLFLGLILRCGEVTSSLIEATHDQLVTFAGGSGQDIQRLLSLLQQLQLVTYTKNEFLLNRKEKKRIEEKRIEVVDTSKKEVATQDSELNKKIWLSYVNAYRLRYGIEPVRNAKVNTQVSQLRKNLGFEDAFEVVKFYLTHNDSYYLKKTHEFGLCLKDSETLTTQMKRGKAITGTMVRSFEKTQQSYELNDQIKTMWSDEDAK